MKKKEDNSPEAQAEEPRADDYLDQLIRLKADFENYRKRVEKEKPELIAWGKAQMLMKLLPLYESVLKAKAQLEKEDSGAGGELKKGLDMIYKEFGKVFESEGIREMDCVGKPYDPMSHEVLAVVEGEDCQDGFVVEEAQKGFLCGEKVLRPAKVCIAKKKEAEPEQTKGE